MPCYPNNMNESSKKPETTRSLGKRAEEAVSDFLSQKGLREITRNYRVNRIGEIDLIFKRKHVLYFVEVRLRKSNGIFGGPEDTIDAYKRKKVYLAANHFVQSYRMTEYDMEFWAACVRYTPGIPLFHAEFRPF